MVTIVRLPLPIGVVETGSAYDYVIDVATEDFRQTTDHYRRRDLAKAIVALCRVIDRQLPDLVQVYLAARKA